MIRLLGVTAAAAAIALAAWLPAQNEGPDLHEQGRAIYNFRCYFCHGYSGDARTLADGLLAQRPRAFSSMRPDEFSPQRVATAVREGRPGTAMASFEGTLDDAEIRAVAHFVVEEFVVRRQPNTRYHTAANGWPDHDRFRSAFRFVREPAALAVPAERLTADEAAGKRLYLSACISCHDGAASEETAVWDVRPMSYPQDGHDCVSCHDRVRYPERGLPVVAPPASYHGAAGLGARPEAATPDAASPYAAHDTPVRLQDPTREEARGEALYAKNCAFCHAADGTARHWIGRFLEPHPRDLTDPGFRASMSRERLAQRIEDGLPGTAMPTWRNVLQRDEIAALATYIERAFGPLGAAPR